MATWFYLCLAGLVLMQGCLAVIVEVTPREVTVLPRQNVTFLCKVGVSLQYCRIEIPGLQPLNLNPQLPPRGGVSYYGAGLQSGQCGFTINSVDDTHNGELRCSLGINTEYTEPSGVMHLTVARPPRSPELELSRGTDSLRVYKVNDYIHATCVVREGRPAANISWFLDDEPLLEGITQPVVLEMAKENLFSTVQNITRVLQPSDNGRMLKCVASHPALLSSNIAQRPLDVKYPPLAQSNPIDKFGYEIGKVGAVTVEIEANPKPHLSWLVRDQTIKEGNHDNTGRIEAEAARDLGRGRYEATLRIAAITKQDTETQYILSAYNDMGTQDYTILISTSPEPEGLDLGIGAIIGIVAAILILLLVVFIVVFARVTGRWCFSAQDRRNIAESSDTESADVGQRDHRRIISPIKLTSFFKKNKDKTANENADDQNAEQEETKVPLEDDQNQNNPPGDAKEGIVYAELDLVHPHVRTVVKPEDDKTEYAEIVYTQKDDEDPNKQETVKGGHEQPKTPAVS